MGGPRKMGAQGTVNMGAKRPYEQSLGAFFVTFWAPKKSLAAGAAKSLHKRQKKSRPPESGLLEMDQTVVRIKLSPSEETLIWLTGCCQLLMIRSAMASSSSFWMRRRRFRAP